LLFNRFSVSRALLSITTPTNRFKAIIDVNIVKITKYKIKIV